MSFGELETAMSFRSVLETIVTEVVDRIRPREQYGWVYSWNRSSGIAQVLLAGDADPINVRFYPQYKGLYVRSISGILADYAAYPKNLLLNPGIEGGPAHWSTIEGWDKTSSASTLERTTEQAHAGTYALKHTSAGSGTDHSIGTRGDDVQSLFGNTYYEWEAWVRSTTAIFVKPRIVWSDERRKVITGEETEGEVIQLAANTWTKISVVAKSPAQARSAIPRVKITDADGNNSYLPPVGTILYGDDFSFHRFFDITTDPTAEATMVKVGGKPGNYFVDEVVRTPDRPTNQVEYQLWFGPGVYKFWRYPHAQKMKFEIQGPGGAGGGAGTTAAGQASEGGGGGGGGFGHDWYDAEDIPEAIEVVIEAPGTGSAGANGATGGIAYFEGLFGVDGGGGGDAMAGTAGPAWSSPGAGGSTWDNGTGVPNTIRGSHGKEGWVPSGTIGPSRDARGGVGGSNNGASKGTSVASANGNNATSGAGGQGGRNAASQGTARSGGNGGQGWAAVTSYF